MDVLRPKVPAGSMTRTPTADGVAVPKGKQKPAEPTAPHAHTPAPITPAGTVEAKEEVQPEVEGEEGSDQA